jgi:hypothetical protein
MPTFTTNPLLQPWVTAYVTAQLLARGLPVVKVTGADGGDR